MYVASGLEVGVLFQSLHAHVTSQTEVIEEGGLSIDEWTHAYIHIPTHTQTHV